MNTPELLQALRQDVLSHESPGAQHDATSTVHEQQVARGVVGYVRDHMHGEIEFDHMIDGVRSITDFDLKSWLAANPDLLN